MQRYVAAVAACGDPSGVSSSPLGRTVLHPVPQGCVPMVCKAEVAGKKSKKEYQPRAMGSCAAGPLFVASSAIRQRQGFAGVQYKKFE